MPKSSELGKNEEPIPPRKVRSGVEEDVESRIIRDIDGIVFALRGSIDSIIRESRGIPELDTENSEEMQESFFLKERKGYGHLLQFLRRFGPDGKDIVALMEDRLNALGKLGEDQELRGLLRNFAEAVNRALELQKTTPIDVVAESDMNGLKQGVETIVVSGSAIVKRLEELRNVQR